MSVRGTITSRTIVSPNSITEWMKLRSSDSIAWSSWGRRPWRALGLGHARRSSGRTEQPITVSAIANKNRETHLIGQNFSIRRTTGGGKRGGVGVLHGVVLRIARRRRR